MWKNFPTTWHSQYIGHHRDATIVVQAVALENMWIWHALLGLPGSLNNVNILQRSPIFRKRVNGEATTCNFTVNGHQYTTGYYQVDKIYPKWFTFVKTIAKTAIKMKAHFIKMQEAARKDIERALGDLQARFAIFLGPTKFQDKKTLHKIISACMMM
jgi:hypothetical protein